MARLNTRPSTRPSSRLQSEQLQSDVSSDQENQDPVNQQRMDKGKGRATDDVSSRRSLPTPSTDISNSSNEARGLKRKRANERRAEERDDDVTDGEQEDEEARFNRHYDPHQDPAERREIKRKSRALEREFHESRDELLRTNGKGLTDTLTRATSIYRDVKQTNDATLDSRLLVNVSDLAYKKTNQLVLGDNSTGVDVDEFLTKCISYMHNGGPLERNAEGHRARPSSSRRRPRAQNDSDDEDDGDAMADGPLDWAILGLQACFPFNARPCVPSFLLGPLSVEKKQRSQTQRRARQTKDTAGREARPEALSREELSHSDENGLTAICKRINAHLNKHVSRAEAGIRQAGLQDAQEFQTHRGRDLLRKYRITDTGGPSLFDYVLNPRSFGQTVENLFYVSFLIKEGTFGIQNDSQGLPSIIPSDPSTLEEQRRNKTSKHQAVFSLDYATWQKLVEAFEVTEPLIEHRRDDETAAQLGQRGWYA